MVLKLWDYAQTTFRSEKLQIHLREFGVKLSVIAAPLREASLAAKFKNKKDAPRCADHFFIE